MLSTFPAVPEHQTKGITPRAACQGHFAQRVSTKRLNLDRLCGRLTPVASLRALAIPVNAPEGLS